MIISDESIGAMMLDTVILMSGSMTIIVGNISTSFINLLVFVVVAGIKIKTYYPPVISSRNL